MILVIDANAMVQIVPKPSKYHWIWDYFFDDKFELAVSTDILNEYHEVLGRWIPEKIVDNILLAIIENPNTKFVSPAYFWKMIVDDKDDNKYADCAVAANADWLISNDGHFKALNNISFPKINWAKVPQVRKKWFK